MHPSHLRPGHTTLRRSRTPLALAAGLLASLALQACQPPPPAPEELDELSAYLFAHFETEEVGVLEEGLGNLEAFFQDVDMEAGYNDRAYGLSVLTEEDVTSVEHPGRDLSLMLPVGMVAESPHPPARHAWGITQSDQTALEPASPNHYIRDFIDPTDPAGFPDQDHLVQRTMNDIRKENLVMDVGYDMHKDFRWAELREPGSGEWAVVGRAWITESAEGSSGNVILQQSFSIDVFLPRGSDHTVRFMGLWSETFIEGVGDDVIEATIKLGVNQMFNATDDFLDEG